MEFSNSNNGEKIPMACNTEMEKKKKKKNPQTVWKHKELRIIRVILNKKNSARDLTIQTSNHTPEP